MTPEQARRVLVKNIRLACASKEPPLAINYLADKARVSRSQLYDLLRGRKTVTIAWLSKVASALGVEPWELLRPGHFDGRRTRSEH